MTPKQKLYAQAAIKLGMLTKPQVHSLRGAHPEAASFDLVAAASTQGFLDLAQIARLEAVVAKVLKKREANAKAAPSAPRTSARAATASERSATRDEPPQTDGHNEEIPQRPAIEGYEVLDRIGLGAMASVWRARHQRLDKEVALKVLAPHLGSSPTDRARFLREARAAAKVSHPNVIRIFDTGDSGGHLFIAMELVDGENLNRIVTTAGPLPEDVVLETGLAVANALHAAHLVNLVHRDVKPDNVMRTRDHRIKLCDLGLAREYGDSPTVGGITEHGVMLGTPFYVSPEQARGLKLDIRSDLYSLGVTMFFMATGEPPFAGRTGPEVMKKHLTDAPPAPSERRPSLSRAFDALVLRLMEKEPKRRFQTPTDICDAIQALLADGTTPPPAPAEPAPAATDAATPGRRGRRKPRRAAAPKAARVDPVARLSRWVAASAALFALLYVVKEMVLSPG